jgi:hypothetical protein
MYFFCVLINLVRNFDANHVIEKNAVLVSDLEIERSRAVRRHGSINPEGHADR